MYKHIIPGYVSNVNKCLSLKHMVMSVLLLMLMHQQLIAQKSFIEGQIVYKVTFFSPDSKEITGTYILNVKGAQLRKELKFNNGYQDDVLINFNSGTATALENYNGEKYAIQMSMDDFLKEWQKYSGFTFREEKKELNNIAGCKTGSGTITYKDGTQISIIYATEWKPGYEHTYERFPGLKYLPLSFSYHDKNGMYMKFEAEKVDAAPVENAVFRKPADYKVISYSDYHEMMK